MGSQEIPKMGAGRAQLQRPKNDGHLEEVLALDVLNYMAPEGLRRPPSEVF